MPAFLDPTGRTRYVPGVYTQTEVVSDLPGPLPEFHVPMIAGDAEWGIPYNVATLQETHEDFAPYRKVGTTSGVQAEFGRDSDLATAARFAKRHGLPTAFYIAANALTRASVIATSAGPISQATVYHRKFGVPGGHVKLKMTGGNTIEITPLKHFSRLTANGSATAVRIYVRDNSWAQIGMAVEVGDNATVNAARTVADFGTEFDSNGQILYWIDLSAAPGAITTANYALIVVYDENAKETSGTLADGQAIVDWFREESEELDVVKEGTFTTATWIALAAATPLKDITAWSTVTDGISPASTVTEHDDLIALLDASLWDAFALAEQTLPRSWLVVHSTNTVHASWRDWATAKRTEGYPVNVTAGCGWGDVVIGAGDTTDPGDRAGDLNSQDVALCANGLDYLGAHLSLAPAVFGRRMAGGARHNLTNDELVFSALEVEWDERESGELTTLHQKGVVTPKLSVGQTIRYRIGQGLSTLQQNSKSWNEGTDDTPLLMQRDLADFVDLVIKRDFEELQIGADKVDPSTIAGVLRRRAEKSLIRRGYILEFIISSIVKDETGNGYLVDWSARLPDTVDFIGVTTKILIGE